MCWDRGARSTGRLTPSLRVGASAHVSRAENHCTCMINAATEKKNPFTIMIGSHSAGNASHDPPRYSPNHHLAGRRQALRPALRLREPLRAGAVRRAHLDDVLNIFQEPLAGTLTFSYHFLTSTHFHSPAAMPAPTQLHLSHAHAQAACAHPHASHTHTMRPFRRVCDYVACDSM